MVVADPPILEPVLQLLAFDAEAAVEIAGTERVRVQNFVDQRSYVAGSPPDETDDDDAVGRTRLGRRLRRRFWKRRQQRRRWRRIFGGEGGGGGGGRWE